MVVMPRDNCSHGVYSYPKGEFEWTGNVSIGLAAQEALLRLISLRLTLKGKSTDVTS